MPEAPVPTSLPLPYPQIYQWRSPQLVGGGWGPAEIWGRHVQEWQRSRRYGTSTVSTRLWSKDLTRCKKENQSDKKHRWSQALAYKRTPPRRMPPQRSNIYLCPVSAQHQPPTPTPPSVLQDAAPIPPGNKDPLAVDVEKYRNILPLPLDGISTSRAGRPKQLTGEEMSQW